MTLPYEVAAIIPPPPGPSERPRSGPGDRHALGRPGIFAEWLGHVEAGRIGGNPPMSEEARAAILANERVIFGRQRTLLG